MWRRQKRLRNENGQSGKRKNESGKFKADFLFSDKAGFSFLKIGAPLDEKTKVTFSVPSFGDLAKMKVGQKILVLGNGVSSFIFDGNKDIKISAAKTNGGALVLDLDGNVLGIALSGETTSFTPIDAINSALKLSQGEGGAMNATPVLAQ